MTKQSKTKSPKSSLNFLPGAFYLPFLSLSLFLIHTHTYSQKYMCVLFTGMYTYMPVPSVCVSVCLYIYKQK